MKNIVIIIGARPNYMKALPLYNILKKYTNITIIHTGQQTCEKMTDIFSHQLGFPKIDIQLTLESMTKAGTYDDLLYINNTIYMNDTDMAINDIINYTGDMGQLGEIRDKLSAIFKHNKPDIVFVLGDITSTLAGAIAAKMNNIPIAHIEAGLRSHDNTMPEEVNRILTDKITKYYFITEESGIDNLKRENLDNGNLYLVNNMMITCLFMFKEKAYNMNYEKSLMLTEKEYVLITLHRPSNVDNMIRLKEIVEDIILLSRTEKILFPVHPRTKKNLDKLNIQFNTNIIICEPLGYLEFICMEIKAKYVITDSGGIQEETTALNIPCFTLRPNTERPSTLIENGGTNTLIQKITSDILLKDYQKIHIDHQKDIDIILQQLFA